jgi:hypothetical protein
MTHTSTPATAPDMVAVHATIAPLDALLEERRILYRLAAELIAPDLVDADLTDDLLDGPVFRHWIGEALAGRARLVHDDLIPAVEIASRDVTAGPVALRVVADVRANDQLADALRVIRAQLSGQPELAVLTESSGRRFASAFAVVNEGVQLVRALSPGLADDLLAHVSLLAILEPGASGGLGSASSRFFPGLVLIEAPSSALEVAEALIHEGAHEKIFDLAITRRFLSLDSDSAEPFRPSWSGAAWPMEQAVAAWHAYTCLAQFAEESRVTAGTLSTGPTSLLPRARERSVEIGRWLANNENYLDTDARWMLRTVRGERPSHERGIPIEPSLDDHYALDATARMIRSTRTGRMVVGRATTPPELFWLDGDAADVASLLGTAPNGMNSDMMLAELIGIWGVNQDAARTRTALAFQSLDTLVTPTILQQEATR